jgi:uncharacterized protein with beta-barrel porin domain
MPKFHNLTFGATVALRRCVEGPQEEIRHVARMSAVSLTALLIPHLFLPAPALAADVEITTSVSNGVNLNGFSGTTAHVNSGVTVNNTGTVIGPGPTGMYASAQAWTLQNDGSITSTGLGGLAVNFTAGGTINNAGLINSTTSNAVLLNNGGTVNNLATGTINANGIAIITQTATATISNAGTINAPINVTGGGSVTNLTGATISATKNNDVAVTVRGGTGRTIINDGTISSTLGNFATGVEIGTGGGTGSVTNQSNGSIFGAYNGAYAGTSVVLTLTNNGQIRSNAGSAVEANGGGTITNTGTIANSGSAGTAANWNGILVRNVATAEIINSGTISGATNAITFAANAGAPAGATHTLRLRTGSVLNGNVVGGTGTDNLILDGTGTEGIAKFSNFETVSMQGTDWTLTGNGTFSTTTTVQSGTLRVNGQLTSPAVGVQSGGTLTGNGTVVGNVTNNTGGNLRVDSGTLAFNGNYIHQSGAFFTVGVTPSSNGVLAITGAGHTATINGGTVRVMAGVGSYAPSTQYTILTTTGGRSGTFSGATSNFAFLDPSLTYDANNVYLTLLRNSIDFAAVGITPSQISAGGGLAALGMANPIVGAALLLTPDQARAAFDSVSGEIHPSLHSLMLDESSLIRDAILGRQRQDSAQASTGAQATGFANEDEAALAYAKKARTARTGPTWPVKAQPPVIAPVYAAWVQGYGNWTRLNGDGNAATLRATNGGAIGGLDVTLNQNWRLGIATGGGRTDARVDARTSSATIDTFHLAAYGGGRIGDIAVRTGAAYSHHDISTTRTIAFPGFADTTTASYGASTSQIFGEAAYGVVRGLVNAEAFANLAYASVRSDGFTESGGPAALRAAQATTSATYSTLGLRAQAPVPAIGPWAVTARGSLGWQHAYDGAAPISLMSFAASPSAFAIAGVPIAADTLLVEAGLDAVVHRNAVLGLLYTGRLAADASAHALRANLTVRF